MNALTELILPIPMEAKFVGDGYLVEIEVEAKRKLNSKMLLCFTLLLTIFVRVDGLWYKFSGISFR
jgi:hypothetical protein